MKTSSSGRSASTDTRPGGIGFDVLMKALADQRWQTRLQLAVRTGLSARTVDRVVRQLLDEELLEEGPPLPGLGRPAVPVRLRHRQRLVGTVALHRDGISSAVISDDGSIHGLIRDTQRRWTDIDDLTGLCRDMLAASMAGMTPVSIDAFVLGFPLPYEQNVGHRPLQRDRSYSQRWMRGNLSAELNTALGIPVAVDNTCRLAALAEHRFGAARDCDDVIYLQLVGGSNTGIIAGGRLLRGTNGFAGEISHLHVQTDGPPCPCGAKGCLGVCIQNSDRLIATWRHLLPEVADVYEVLNLAAQGDSRLRELLYELGLFMGEYLAAGCIMLNPERLVIDGSLGLAVGPVVAGVTAALKARLPDRVFESLTVTPGRLGSEAALMGAAAL